jgi:hypothetical protein
MAARFPADWRENKGIELSGGIHVNKSDEELDREIAAKKAALGL